MSPIDGIGKNYTYNVSPYNRSNLPKTEGVEPSSNAVNNNDPEVKLMKKIGAIECNTCKERKYQDGSDDPGVSFKSPTHVSPEASGAAVMSHELEHVSREQSKAGQEGRKVVAQSVQTYSGVCPECGKVYTAGGKTTTVTKADEKNDYFMENMRKSLSNYFGKSLDIKV